MLFFLGSEGPCTHIRLVGTNEVIAAPELIPVDSWEEFRPERLPDGFYRAPMHTGCMWPMLVKDHQDIKWLPMKYEYTTVIPITRRPFTNDEIRGQFINSYEQSY